MGKPMSDEFYEEQFEFPLWKLIKQRAVEKDISYAKAAREVTPEYAKSEKIRYRDEKFQAEAILKRQEELLALAARYMAEAQQK
jgi:hypothetical protein